MNKRFIINLSGNFLSFGVALLVSIWLTPFIIGNLGSEAYGFIPLSQTLVDYMAVISIALTGMLQRFFTLSVKSGKMDDASRYFATAFYSSLFLSVILFIPVLISTIFIGSLINIPQSLLLDVRITFFVMGINFLLNLIFNSFYLGFFSENRLELNSIGAIIAVVVRTILLVSLMKLLPPKIWYTAIAAIVPSIVLIFYNFYFFKRLLPQIVLSRKLFDIEKLKELIASGIWASINSLGAIFYLRIDMLVSNLMLGALIAGEYSAILTWSNMLRGIASTITSVFGPSLIRLYAEEKFDEFVNYSNFSVRVTGIILAIPIGIICGFGDRLLLIWLGESFVRYYGLLILTVFHLSINLSVQSLFGIFTAYNKIKFPAIVTIIMGLMNLAMALVFTKFLGLGIYGIALAGVIMLTAKNVIFTPIYSARISGQRWFAYYRGIITPVLATCMVFGISFILKEIFLINTWKDIIFNSIAVMILYCIFAIAFLLKKNEKIILVNTISKKLTFLNK